MRLLIRWALILCLTIFLAQGVGGQPGASTLILGDNSGSMRGFVETGGGRIASLYHLLSRITLSSQLRALSDGSIRGPERPSTFFSSARNYRGGTDLIRALSDIRQQQLQQSLLVTDGMQSEGKYLGLKEQLKQMATDGWGIWLFALNLPFDGIIDPEQMLELEALRPEIENCIRQYDQSFSISIKPGSKRSYAYKGSRPLLIFLFQKDGSAGRQMAQNILSNLEADPQFAPKVVEIAPLVRRGVNFSDPVQVDLADALRVDHFSAGNPTIRSDTVDGKRLKELRIPIVWEASPPSLLQALNEIPRYEVGQYTWLDGPPETEGAQEGQDPNQVTGNVKIKLISELGFFRRNFCWLPFVSCSSEQSDPLDLHAWSEYSAADNVWWNEMNIDNSWQCPGKVYKLAELINEVSYIAADRHKADNPPKKILFKLVVGPL